MIHVVFRNLDNQTDFAWWNPSLNEKQPDGASLKLKEVLQIDVSKPDIQLLQTLFPTLPVARHRDYTRYQGDLAKFIWDNL